VEMRQGVPVYVLDLLRGRPILGIGVVEVIVCGKVPKHGLPLSKDIIPQKEIVRFLSLAVQKGVVVVALEALNHVPGVACPLIDLAVCFHGIY